MINLINLPIEKMAGISFNCECGHSHSSGVKEIYTGLKAKEELAGFLRDRSAGNILFTADSNTWKVSGREISGYLSENKFNVRPFVFEVPEGRSLVPDEKAIGRLLLETGKDISLIVTAGSGTLNDLSRYISFMLDIPYIILCTAPSIDGYASTVSPLIIGGFKKTFEAVYPDAVIADENVICGAPPEMIRAGFGDLIGKFTALSDWELSNKENGEYICSACLALMKKAVSETVSAAPLIGERNPKGVKVLFNSLILSGIAMGLVGNSRPASGAEHHLAHYWEMKAISRGEEHALHGSAVGVGAVVISEIYEYLKDNLGFIPFSPGPEYITELLKITGGAASPMSIGISRDDFHESLLHAMEVRPRYTILSYLHKNGMLARTAERLTAKYYV